MKKLLIRLLPTHCYLMLRWYDFKLNRKNSFNKIQALRSVDDESTGGYLPFDKAKAIFVHIPKCAGISVNKALFGSIAGGHTTLDQYINVFPPAQFQSYFRFSFVRNPWDRVVSAYCFLQKGGINKWDADFYEKEIKPFGSFEDFVKGWLKPENLTKHHHFKPQYLYLIDKYDKVTVDYIAYFENIEEDFKTIAKRIGVKNTLAKNNAVNRADYRSFYNDETREIVAEVYKKDIALFHYNFAGVESTVRKLKL
ncbi:sulfotransferase family 2 domain-containing protein [Glaciecola siphonariae]|uniref:Sulfotransferase family 2 domain-containing protein n=1 Tax=Glaciecola siphonariae TaxID=521012 RepID=A0ABV9LUF6_9ALTE